jgi:putative membrane protein
MSEPAPNLLAIERTRAAYDRTLMAAVRTATSLITFGFAIYKFFQLEITSARGDTPIGPREFSLLMIVTGLLTLISGMVEYWRDIRRLRSLQPDMHLSRSLVPVVFVFVSLLGALALAAVVFRD